MNDNNLAGVITLAILLLTALIGAALILGAR